MKRAHKRDAVLNEKFYFRKEIMSCKVSRKSNFSSSEIRYVCLTTIHFNAGMTTPAKDCDQNAKHSKQEDGEKASENCCQRTEDTCCCECVELSVNEIINGKVRLHF